MLAAYGHWDVLVNNAAVAITKPFAQIIEADFDLSSAVNVKASSGGWITGQNIRVIGGTA